MSPRIFIAVLGSVPVILGTVALVSAQQNRTAQSACAAEMAPASIVGHVPADYPPLAAEQRLSGTASVRVDLARSGAVQKAIVAKSSGSASLDQAALEAARQQKYAPQIIACQAIAGSYLIDVDFHQ